MTHTLEQGNTMPEKRIRIGGISATIWTNRSKSGDGEYKTVSFERTYKDADGNWQNTNSLRVGDLHKARLVLQKALEFCHFGEV